MILFQVEPEQDTKVAEKKSTTNEKNLSGSAAEVIGKVILIKLKITRFFLQTYFAGCEWRVAE